MYLTDLSRQCMLMAILTKSNNETGTNTSAMYKSVCSQFLLCIIILHISPSNIIFYDLGNREFIK